MLKKEGPLKYKIAAGLNKIHLNIIQYIFFQSLRACVCVQVCVCL